MAYYLLKSHQYLPIPPLLADKTQQCDIPHYHNQILHQIFVYMPQSLCEEYVVANHQNTVVLIFVMRLINPVVDAIHLRN